MNNNDADQNSTDSNLEMEWMSMSPNRMKHSTPLRFRPAPEPSPNVAPVQQQLYDLDEGKKRKYDCCVSLQKVDLKALQKKINKRKASFEIENEPRSKIKCTEAAKKMNKCTASKDVQNEPDAKKPPINPGNSNLLVVCTTCGDFSRAKNAHTCGGISMPDKFLSVINILKNSMASKSKPTELVGTSQMLTPHPTTNSTRGPPALPALNTLAASDQVVRPMGAVPAPPSMPALNTLAAANQIIRPMGAVPAPPSMPALNKLAVANQIIQPTRAIQAPSRMAGSSSSGSNATFFDEFFSKLSNSMVSKSKPMELVGTSQMLTTRGPPALPALNKLAATNQIIRPTRAVPAPSPSPMAGSSSSGSKATFFDELRSKLSNISKNIRSVQHPVQRPDGEEDELRAKLAKRRKSIYCSDQSDEEDDAQ